MVISHIYYYHAIPGTLDYYGLLYIITFLLVKVKWW